MRRPGRIPRWCDMSTLNAPLVIATLAVLALALALILPFSQRVRSARADAAPPPSPAPIDGDRAYTYLKAICDLGPRTAGSAANGRQRAMVAAHFEKMGAKLAEQRFASNDPRTRQ